MYQTACCLYNTAVVKLEEAGLNVPSSGGPDHRGPDGVCCDSLTVFWDTTTGNVNADERDHCNTPLRREIVIYYTGLACTEGEGIERPCDPVEDPCPSDGDGCTEPIPMLAVDCDAEKPTVAQETAAVWAIRSILEEVVVCEAKCCIQKCGPGRCSAGKFTSSSGQTEGGCFYIDVRLEIEW